MSAKSEVPSEPIPTTSIGAPPLVLSVNLGLCRRLVEGFACGWMGTAKGIKKNCRKSTRDFQHHLTAHGFGCAFALVTAPPFRVAPKLEKIGPLSQEALTEQSGLSLWHRQDVEAMRRKGLRLSTIERIARALGVPVWRLLQAGRFPETKRPRGKTGSRIKRWDTG